MRTSKKKSKAMKPTSADKSTLLRQEDVGKRSKVNPILNLQSTIGNQAVKRMLLRSPGQPLDVATRTFMEPRFGYDFSGVRVHFDEAAAKSARDVNAHAYTVGQNIVFGAGRFAPETEQGQHLIAHELTHVVQQSGAHPEPNPAQSNVVQRQATQEHEKSESDVVQSVMEALQRNPTAGANVDPAFETLNPHPLPSKCGFWRNSMIEVIFMRSSAISLLEQRQIIN